MSEKIVGLVGESKERRRWLEFRMKTDSALTMKRPLLSRSTIMRKNVCEIFIVLFYQYLKCLGEVEATASTMFAEAREEFSMFSKVLER